MDLAIGYGVMSEQAFVDTFERNRTALQGMAYRMLGELGAAEDAVQETYLRWHKADRAGIDAPRAWLLTTCARLCIDELRSARARREAYVGPWLPEPLITAEAPQDPVERSQSLSLAFLLLLQELRPAERAAYVLREVFELGYEEIARTLDKTAAACRQIVSRASRKLHATPIPMRPDIAATARFAAALTQADMAGLLRLLTEDAVLLSDGGGKVVAARNPIRGAERVARFLLGVARKAGPDLVLQPIAINGGPGFIMYRGTRLIAAIGFAAQRQHLATIYVVRNPDKLTRVPEAGGARMTSS